MTEQEEREEFFRTLVKRLAYSPDAMSRRETLRLLVWDRTGRMPLWAGDELRVPFDHAERESGYADEMLSAVDDLLAELGCADVQVVAEQTGWDLWFDAEEMR